MREYKQYSACALAKRNGVRLFVLFCEILQFPFEMSL